MFWGGIAGGLVANDWRSTGVAVYSGLCLANLAIAFFTYLSPRPETINAGRI